MVLGYLDPGSGSAMISVAAAGLAGVGVAVSAGFGRFKGRLKKSDASPTDTDEATEETSDATVDADSSDG
jgi:hypothetical protein